MSRPVWRRGVLSLLRRGHIVLGTVVLSIILALIFGAFVSVGEYEGERRTVLSQETDGAAVTFVQRDSFALIFTLDSWARGDATARDVQIARALLGQRLSVVTSSGTRTIDLAEEGYVTSLQGMDEIVVGLSDVPDTSRSEHRGEVADAVDSFATETRMLSQTFDALFAQQVAQSWAERTRSQVFQGGFSLIALILGLSLAAWLMVDINRSYRQSALRLAVERAQLDRARASLEFRRSLDESARRWNDAIAAEAPSAAILETLRADLRALLPSLRIDVDVAGARTTGASAVQVLGVRDATTAVDSADVAAALVRAEEIVALLRARASIEETFATQLAHDALTGLPNRLQLAPALADALARSDDESTAAVMLVNLDRFAEFNTTFGHAEGDLLLIEIAHRLRAVSASSTVLRLSSDEFAVVAVVTRRDAVASLAREVSDNLHFEREVGSATARISVAVGVAVADDRSTRVESIIVHATAALSAARRQSGHPRINEFDLATDFALTETLREESALRAALRSGEFRMHFQPIIRLSTDTVVGAEALVRWERPGLGVVAPGDFLPAIARAGLTIDLGWQVIDQSLEAWSAIRAACAGSAGFDHDAYVSINVDAEHFAMETLAQHIAGASDRLGVPRHCVLVEVTEHVLLDGEEAMAQVHALREAGIRVALDDFGTGYSNLFQTVTVPFDVIKIDRSFMPVGALTAQHSTLIRNVVSLATSMGASVIAEGVESEHVAEALMALEIDVAQGWLYSKALPSDDVRRWISERGASLAARD
ncbi:MAG: hypothetical protein CMF57_11435 [Leifsonia sp.]|nr:hypothetical protein [Leifsonia sp.]